MVIVDSTVWIDYLAARDNPETAWLRKQYPAGNIALTDLILCEVLQGIRNVQDFERVRQQLRVFPTFASSGAALAVAAAENYRILRKKGMTVRTTIDCLIATFCIDNGHALLHRDRDFDPFEEHLDLKVIRP